MLTHDIELYHIIVVNIHTYTYTYIYKERELDIDIDLDGEFVSSSMSVRTSHFLKL